MSGSSNNRIFRNHKIHGYSADIGISSSHKYKVLRGCFKRKFEGGFFYVVAMQVSCSIISGFTGQKPYTYTYREVNTKQI